MADQLLKAVRITDNIKLEVYQQGRKRKYALFYDSEMTKSEKYDVSLTDDQVIQEALSIYNIKYANDNKTFKVIQDPYKDPFVQRTYGNGDKSPYYINNGCGINILWEGYANSSPVITSQSDINDPNVANKVVTVYLPSGFTENNGKGYLVWTTNGFNYSDKVNIGNISNFGSYVEDHSIVDIIISRFQSDVKTLHGLSEYDLKLCSPDTESCSIITYKSPLEAPKSTNAQLVAAQTPPSPTQSIPKIKFTIDGLGDTIQVKAKTDLDTFTVWTGPIPKPADQIDQFDNLGELDPEYTESSYAGFEETGIDYQTWKVQDAVSNGQEDCSQPPTQVGTPANVKLTTTYNDLMNLAGRCARELGKNNRVNADNLKKGYTPGIHGLCPQGTQAVLYALTGIKALGQLVGNADWFSFKSPTLPGGGDGKGNLSNTGYYNQKVKISQNSGSWKGTYLTDSSQWQVGDVIAMGYVGKEYGHIQCYTGYCWQSDFKQNAIQQNHVDVNSVALWRLNDKGLQAIKNLSAVA